MYYDTSEYLSLRKILQTFIFTAGNKIPKHISNVI